MKSKTPGAKERREAATAALTIAVEQTVAEAARAQRVDHEFVLRHLREIAENPYQMPAARVSALAQIADIIGTKKQVAENHLHLHHTLEQVPTERLEARLVQLLSGVNP